MITWNKVQADRWLGQSEHGHYHVMKTTHPERPFAVCFVPTVLPRADRPSALGYRSTLANAQYCADIHDRLALMDKGQVQ